jgi:hypothetical protein
MQNKTMGIQLATRQVYTGYLLVLFSCFDVPAMAQQTNTDLSNLSQQEKSSIESACNYDKVINGPAAYNNCLRKQLTALSAQGNNRPDLSSLSQQEKSSIESACNYDKVINGPAAYNNCLRKQLTALSAQGNNRPDLSSLSQQEKSSIESACNYDKVINGPAAYNNCLRNQLTALSAQENYQLVELEKNQSHKPGRETNTINTDSNKQSSVAKLTMKSDNVSSNDRGSASIFKLRTRNLRLMARLRSMFRLIQILRLS